jgi:diguanylate cyclase (GGDEF)-like protein/PAS domain S-box-containing protein
MSDRPTLGQLDCVRDPAVFRTLVESALVGVYLIQDERFLYVNPQLAEMFRYGSAEEVIGLRVADLVWPADRSTVIGNIRSRIAGDTQSVRYQFRGLSADGDPVAVEVRGTATMHEGRRAVIGTIIDISAQQRQEQRIRRLAYFDALSHLPNRRYLTRQARHDIALARRLGRCLSLLYVDLDRFKVINDNWGHRFGDAVIKAVARRFQEQVRDSDTLARLGGDEFVLLLPDTGEDEALALADRLDASLREPVRVSGMDMRVSASMGIATQPEHGNSLDELLKHADIAMYKAKRSGQTACCYRRDDSLRLRRQVDLERELAQALDDSDLFLHFQPRVNLRDGSVESVEALARWSRHGQELVSPAVFIAAAEESGLIHRLGQWALEEACRQAAQWEAEGLPLRVAVNVSGREMDRGRIVDRFESVLAASGLAAERLEVEITESAAVRDMEAQNEQLSALRRLGVRIAVDDFGTGYSSLRYLHLLPLDAVKIDRSFVQDIDDPGGVSRRVVETIIALAGNLGCETVAEGIETAGQAATLRELGCRYGQGFHYCAPVAASQVSALWKLGALGKPEEAVDLGGGI